MKNTIIVTLLAIFMGLDIYAQQLEVLGSQWSQLEMLEEKNQPKSAKEVANTIYTKAKQNGHASDYLKAILHIAKYEKQAREKTIQEQLQWIDHEQKTCFENTSSLLHIVQAELYWNYFQQNQWKIIDRDPIASDTLQDITYWSVHRFYDEVISHYRNAIAEVSEQPLIPLFEYSSILSNHKPEEKQFCQTLQDFVYLHAIEFFTSTGQTHSKPEKPFVLSKLLSRPFVLADEFVNSDLTISDSLSIEYQSLLCFHDYSRFLIKHKKESMLIQIELHRLEYSYQLSNDGEKFFKYTNALKKLYTKYQNHSDAGFVLYQLADFYYENESNQINQPDSINGYVIADRYCDTIQKIFPRTLPSKWGELLRKRIRQKELSFQLESNILPEKYQSIGVSCKNLDSCFISIHAIDQRQYEKMLFEDRKRTRQERARMVFDSSRKVFKEFFILPKANDFQSHFTEYLLPPLKTGFYVIFVMENEKPDSVGVLNYESFRVTNLLKKQKIHNNKITYQILNRTTGKPVSKAKVELIERDFKCKSKKACHVQKAILHTDGTGRAVYANTQKRIHLRSMVSFKGDTLQDLHFNYIYQTAESKPVKKKLSVFTDRSIYRPGQKLYFKGILLENEGKETSVVPNEKVTVIFKDVNWKEIKTIELETNKYGSVSHYFEIPEGKLNGNYHIEFRTEGVRKNHSVSVEAYKRPKTEVSLFYPEHTFTFGDSIMVTGEVISYSGAPMNNTEVRYTVYQTHLISFWREPSENHKVSSGTMSTDEKGRFQLHFHVDSLLHNSNVAYDVTVDVTDASGETNLQTLKIPVRSNAFSITPTVNDEYDNSKFISIPIQYSNSKDVPIQASSEVYIVKLIEPDVALRKRHWQTPDLYSYSKNEWDSLYSGNVYGFENDMYLYPLGDTVEILSTPKAKYDTLRLNNTLQQGTYALMINAKDMAGNLENTEFRFQVWDFSAKNTPANIPFEIVPKHTDVKVGDELEFMVYASGGAYLSWEVESNGEVLKSDAVEVVDKPVSLTIRVTEEMQGNSLVHFISVKNSRDYSWKHQFAVPYVNDKLNITLNTFRDVVLPGTKENWNVTVTNDKGKPLTYEMLIGMYDASLDAFVPNKWSFHPHGQSYSRYNWSVDRAFSYCKRLNVSNVSYARQSIRYPQLNWFGLINNYSWYRNTSGRSRMKDAIFLDEEEEVAEEMVFSVAKSSANQDASVPITRMSETAPPVPPTPYKALRTNLNETAFFYPHIETSKKGKAEFTFTVPDALTRWNLQVLAHTEDVMYGVYSNQIVTQKQIMVQPNWPRFVREGDTIKLSTRVSNLTDEVQTVEVSLRVTDDQTNSTVLGENTLSKSVTIQSKQTDVVGWEIVIPDSVQLLSCSFFASNAEHSDGEKNVLPVLKNTILVTESLPIRLPGKGDKSYTFSAMKNKQSPTLQNYSYTVELTANPIWYAIQALPYLADFPHECAEQTFSRYFAYVAGSHLLQSSEEYKNVIEQWKADVAAVSFQSQLERNPELRSLLLQETPWIADAQDERLQRQRLSLLLDSENIAVKQKEIISRLVEMQHSNGAWPWFSGGRSNRAITQHICLGFAQQQSITGEPLPKELFLEKTIGYLDSEIVKHYDRIKSTNKSLESISFLESQYLYLRYLYPQFTVDTQTQEAIDFFRQKAQEYWGKSNLHTQAMLALAFYHQGENVIAEKIMISIHEHAVIDDEYGRHWNISSGWLWEDAPVETQALLIEATELILKDSLAVNQMKQWLLNEKRTHNWKTTKATVSAIYALLNFGSDWIHDQQTPQMGVGGKTIFTNDAEAGTGYQKKVWQKDSIYSSLSEIEIKNPNDQPLWGAVHWQYFEHVDRVQSFGNDLKVKTQLYLQTETAEGTELHPISEETIIPLGATVKVRMYVSTERSMEYVHLKAMSASAFEPTNVFSGYRWENGVGYYQSTKDASTHFFVDYLPVGKHMFEYTLSAEQTGSFSNGITTIQCMYAPEFGAHTGGVRVSVDKN